MALAKVPGMASLINDFTNIFFTIVNNILPDSMGFGAEWMRDSLVKTDLVVSNMCGPRKPLKYLGFELEDILLFNPGPFGEPIITIISIGNNFRLTLTYERDLTDDEVAK